MLPRRALINTSSSSSRSFIRSALTDKAPFRAFQTASLPSIRNQKSNSTSLKSHRASLHSSSAALQNFAYMGDNIVNFYAGAPPLNRLSFHRNSTERMNEHLAAEDARFIVFRDGKPLIRTEQAAAAGAGAGHDSQAPTELLFLSRKQVEPFLGRNGSLFAETPADAEPGSKFHQSASLPETLPALVFLGVDDRPSASKDAVPAREDPQNPQGVPYFAIDVPASSPDGADSAVAIERLGGSFQEARAAASHLSAWEAGIFAEARAMVDWNTRNKHCPACGARTYSLWAGWKRACVTALEKRPEGQECPSTKGLQNFSYPRTDPVIIMGILNSSGDHLLMGRQKSWPKGMYSCLAGFIEPGESFEDAVRREVMEEAGITVGPVRYSSSQPWPYPSNLMVGCYGQATSDDQRINLELDNELEDARWFSREDVRRVLSDPAGTVIRRGEHNKFQPKDDPNSPQYQGKPEAAAAAGTEASASNDDTSAALAPSEGKVAAKSALDSRFEAKEKLANERMQDGALRFRVPPATAIAGQLIKLWAEGGLEATAAGGLKAGRL